MTGAIVLAAGRARRMGTQKLVLPFADSTVIGRVVEQVLASSVTPVVVVVRDDRGPVGAALAGLPVQIVPNPAADQGMLTSVRCGLRHLPSACDHALIVLGDQPRVSAAVIDHLLESSASTTRGIVVPLYDGRRGHPVVISLAYREEILTRFDDVGLRGLLREHPDDVLELPVDDDGVTADIDSPEDYDRERRLFVERGSHEPPDDDRSAPS